MSLRYLPPVRPSAIALGTLYTHAAEQAVLTPLFGHTYQHAKATSSKEGFLRGKEAGGAVAAWGTSLVGSAMQAYGVAALINATSTLSYKGAAYLGGLLFMATSAPMFITQLVTENRPLDTIGVSVLAKVFETIGLSVFLNYWGTRTDPY